MTITNKHGIAALRWILDHQSELGLIRQEVAVLAGAKSEGEIEAWLSSEELVPESSIRRLGLLLGIYKGLVEATPSGQEKLVFARAASWRTPTAAGIFVSRCRKRVQLGSCKNEHGQVGAGRRLVNTENSVVIQKRARWWSFRGNQWSLYHRNLQRV